MFDEKFQKILTMTWKENSRLTHDAFTLEAKAELQKLIDAGKTESLAGYPDDFTVTRVFIDQESAEAWEATMRSLGAKYGFTVLSAVHQDRAW